MLPTKAVKAILTNTKGEILLLKRTLREKDVINYDLPGGLIEPGEDELEALQREVREELHTDILNARKGKTWHFLRPKDNQTVNVQNYTGTIKGEITLSKEHSAYAWVKEEKIRTYPVKDKSFYDAL